jgi:hypothetical protein
LNVRELEVLGDMVLNTHGDNMARVTGETASITGALRGTGMLSATTVVHDGGQLRPGFSPGHLHFADLTLASGSTTTMELEGPALGQYDQVTVNAGGDLTIEGTSALVLDTDYPLALGAVTRIFNFDTGSIDGFFGTASATGTSQSRLVLNLATGSVVGLGNNTLGQLKALPMTDNQQAMLDGLLVNEAGGVGQFYGGRFVENLTQTWANNGDRDAVFERASPEVYAGLGAMAQSAALSAVTKWGHSFVGESGRQGTFVDINSATFSADDNFTAAANGGTQMAFGTRTTNATVGVSRALTDNTSLVFSIGTASTKLNGDYTVGEGQGMTTGLALVGRLMGSERLYWSTGIRHAGLTSDGTRQTNNGSVAFGEVDSSATQFNLGLEYHRASETRSFGLRGNLVFGSSQSDAFDERAVGNNPLDAMSVEHVKTDYARFEVGVRVGADVAQRTRVFGTLDASMPISDDLYGVGASYDNGQGAFSVNALGLDAASVTASIGVDRDISENGRLSVSVGANNDWEGESAVNASIAARFNF